MKKRMLAAIIVASMVCLPFWAAAQESADLTPQEKKETGSKLKTFPVKIKYMDGGKVIPNAEVYFSYCDETSALVDKTANTGNGKTVTFNVPLNDDGSSCPFIVLFSKEDVAEAKKMHASGSLRMYRRPAGETCEYLEFQIRKEGGGTNQGCSIQMWSCGKK
jgi:hypothetical protein